MAKMTLHFLNARDQLSGLRDWLAEVLNTGFDRSAALLPLRDTDVLVKAGESVILEKGHLGYAPEPGLIYVTLDPSHTSLRENADRSIERMLAHELHHSSRWDGPGYGDTLGAALVSEGLAGHFAQEAFGGQPEPWEKLVVSSLQSYVTRAQGDWDRAGYDHQAWFFGSAELPRWLGYSLGYQMVGRYLVEHSHARPSGLVYQDAEAFRSYLTEV